MMIREYRGGDEESIVELIKVCFEDSDRWGVTTEGWLSYEDGDYGSRRDNAPVA